jgi:hypothetical protein
MPTWLNDLCETNGVWDDVVLALYAIFRHDFPDNPPTFRGNPVWWDRRVLDRFEETFWHLITKKDEVIGERLFDPRRAERLPWCAPTIRNCNEPEVKCWRYLEPKGEVMNYVWLEAYDYVICLKERRVGRRDVYFLVSAHHVDGDSRRRNLSRKYSNRLP